MMLMQKTEALQHFGQMFNQNLNIMSFKKLKILLVLACVLSSFWLSAQEDESNWQIGTDVVSRYIWRGLKAGGSSPAIQPTIEYAFGNEKNAFAIGAWGSYSVSGTQTTQEIDLYLSYTFNEIVSLIVTDYYLPDETNNRNGFFNMNTDWKKIDAGTKAQTGHVLEAALQFNGTEKLPLSVLFGVNIWGADARKFAEDANGGMTAEDKIVMSKYLEIGYATTIRNADLEIFAGMALDNPKTDKGEPAGYYRQESAGIINLGFTISKEIAITDRFSLPVFGSFILNPEAENAYMVFGISL